MDEHAMRTSEGVFRSVLPLVAKPADPRLARVELTLAGETPVVFDERGLSLAVYLVYYLPDETILDVQTGTILVMPSRCLDDPRVERFARAWRDEVSSWLTSLWLPDIELSGDTHLLTERVEIIVGPAESHPLVRADREGDDLAAEVHEWLWPDHE